MTIIFQDIALCFHPSDAKIAHYRAAAETLRSAMFLGSTTYIPLTLLPLAAVIVRSVARPILEAEERLESTGIGQIVLLPETIDDTDMQFRATLARFGALREDLVVAAPAQIELMVLLTTPRSETMRGLTEGAKRRVAFHSLGSVPDREDTTFLDHDWRPVESVDPESGRAEGVRDQVQPPFGLLLQHFSLPAPV